MKQAKPKRRLKSASKFVFEAVSGRLGVSVMVVSYAFFAVVLLAYVSTQVYTSSLEEGIAKRKTEERLLREELGLLMSNYMDLSSKERIADWCEDKLGMVEADTQTMTRVSLNNDFEELASPVVSARIPAVLGSEMGQLTEAMRR